MCILHIGTKRKLLTKAGSPNILVHVVALYDAVLGFLCCRVLCPPDVHTRVSVFAVHGLLGSYLFDVSIIIVLYACDFLCFKSRD